MSRQSAELDLSYLPARGPVLLLSCMDLRFLDEIIQFMAHDGLTNRYDHVIFAGAALGALGVPGAKDGNGNPIDLSHWNRTFEDHLGAALKLHHIKDVYILEHRDCGAYREFLGKAGDFDEDQTDEEEACHKKYADQLKTAIEKWAKDNGTKLRVKSFLMGLRGEVKCLTPIKSAPKPRRRKP